MKKILLYTILLFIYSKNFAQDSKQTEIEMQDKSKNAHTIDALKVAYITKELNLTLEEAQKFWPVYNEFTSEIKKAKIEFKQDEISFQEKKLSLMKQYRNDFKKLLINENRVKQCFRAEPEFHKILRNEWQRRQGLKLQNHLPNARNQGLDYQPQHQLQKQRNTIQSSPRSNRPNKIN